MSWKCTLQFPKYPGNLEILAAFYENPKIDMIFKDILNCHDCQIQMPYVLRLTVFRFTGYLGKDLGETL